MQPSMHRDAPLSALAMATSIRDLGHVIWGLGTKKGLSRQLRTVHLFQEIPVTQAAV